jgi:TonB-linked SusC/RagA family outer membrane protein
MFLKAHCTRYKTGLTKTLRIMKLTAVILLSACLAASANGHSQNVTLNLKDAPLEKVFNEIRKQTGYDFVYKTEVLEHASKVNVNVQNASLQQVLDLCFKDQPLTYKIFQSFIAVKSKDDPTILKEENVPPPPIDVTGRVVNEKGEPVPGASVQVKGSSTKGTITDANGYFTLKAIDENATLVISAVNIEEYSIKVNGKTDLFTLNVKTKVTTGEEITVNTGYQILKPNEVTGSVIVITKEQLDKRVAPDLLSKLEGITNGLAFNKDAITGENRLRIRGESTIYGYTNPLIVVDNFPYPYEKINEINPNDVESVTILKDASASSIWGAQAGNGVIVITTKRGKTNQPLRLELNASTTITKKPDLFYVPYINSSDFIDFETFLFKQGRYSSSLSDPNMPALSPVVEILNSRALGLITSSDSASQINALRKYDWRNDFLNYLYRNSVNQQYQINLSGGGNKFGYYFSAGYDKALTNLVGSDNSRITFNNRTSFNPINNLEIQTEIAYLEGTTNSNSVSSNSNMYPYSRLVDENGKELPVRYHRAIWEDTIVNHGFLNWLYYPLQERELRSEKTKSYTTRLGASIKYKIYKGLTAEASYQYYHSIDKNTSLISSQSNYIRNQINRFAIVDNNGNFIRSNYPVGGQLNLATGEIFGQNGRIKVNYSHNWGNNSVVALLGADIREMRSEGNTSAFYGYNENTGSFISPDPITFYPTYMPSGPSGTSSLFPQNLGLSNYEQINRFRSYFTNASYTFKQRYTISGSARLDQANIFGVKTNQKGTPLWSAGGKWEISKESFYKSKFIPNLALRVSYGYQGNFSPDAVAVITLKYDGNPATYTGLPTAQINNFPNPKLRWEKSGQLNIGLDFAAKNSTISGTIDYFRKNGKDLIGSSPIDPTTGISSLTGNFADMKSKGIDLSVSAHIFNAKTIKWTSSFIFNYAAEKITRYEVPNSNAQYLIGYKTSAPKVGYPIHGFFSYQWGGLDPTNGNPRIILGDSINETYSNATLNSIKFEDLVFSGRYDPPYAGSLYNTISWKNLSLGFNITYKLGHYFRRQSINYSAFETEWRAGHSDYNLRWKIPGDETITNVPSFIYPSPSNIRDQFYLNSTALVERADHIRLQFINVNYQVNLDILKKIGLINLNLYFYANNIGILWKANKHGIDPDYPYMSYPPPRSYSFGLKAGF